MKKKRFLIVELSLAFAGLVSGCGADQANRIAAMQARDAESRSKPDNVDPLLLHAGLDAMQPRVRRTVDAYSRIQPTAEFRYFMHPTMDKDAIIEFDIANLASITFSPRIGRLDASCSRDRQAGVVEMSYTLDDKTPVRLTVDRDFEQLIPVSFDGANTLTVRVGEGNGVVTCDWFGLGVFNVRPG